jgi:hypothetical protein
MLAVACPREGGGGQDDLRGCSCVEMAAELEKEASPLSFSNFDIKPADSEMQGGVCGLYDFYFFMRQSSQSTGEDFMSSKLFGLSLKITKLLHLKRALGTNIASYSKKAAAAEMRAVTE